MSILCFINENDNDAERAATSVAHNIDNRRMKEESNPKMKRLIEQRTHKTKKKNNSE